MIVVIALAIVWLVAVVFFRLNRIWLFYYLAGSVGLAFIVIFLGRALFLETAMEEASARAVHAVSSLAGVPTRIFQASPGSLLVMIIAQEVGWTVVQITIECSGLLEIAVISGIVLFYPGWSLGKRLYLTAIGTAVTFIANIVRLFFIIELLHHFGKGSIFLSHTIGGRAIFFVMVVGIYWFVLTRPTLRDVRRKLAGEMEK